MRHMNETRKHQVLAKNKRKNEQCPKYRVGIGCAARNFKPFLIEIADTPIGKLEFVEREFNFANYSVGNPLFSDKNVRYLQEMEYEIPRQAHRAHANHGQAIESLGASYLKFGIFSCNLRAFKISIITAY
jgi:hypothetical protein